MKSEFVGAIARSSCSVTVHSHNNNVLSTCMYTTLRLSHEDQELLIFPEPTVFIQGF